MDALKSLEAIPEQIKAVAAGLDDAARQQLVNLLSEQILLLEGPFDTLRRLINGQPALAVARVACDLGILKRIAEGDSAGEEKGLRLEDLASHAGASVDLLGSIMRFLAAVGIVKELGSNLYGANDLTKAMARPEYEASLRHFFDMISPVLQVLPSHLKAQGYRSVSEMDKTAMQAAFQTDLSAFDYIMTQPHRFMDMQQVMTIQRTATQWFEVAPFSRELPTWQGENVAFVDIGGGRGHQCEALKKQHPHLSDHIVLQDLAETVKGLQSIQGVELMAHDFLTPQPVKGARFYYLRSVLHDWSDEKCVTILKNIVPAMEPESQILIDEVVLPDTGVNWQMAQMDLIMMASFGAKERTEENWRAVCDAAGLDIKDVVTYAHANRNSVVIAVKK